MSKKIGALFCFLGLTLTACAYTYVMPVSENSVELDVMAAPACGISGAQKLMLRDAAVATIQNNYDDFIFAPEAEMSNSYTNRRVVVEMFHDSDAGAANAISARTTLGGDWQNIVNNGFPSTCTS